ncbi:MAG: hypothetical protein M4579_003434 [Chaenotheca gracillima]|nr:MAG: hypothetical protein M4579_003434 [Chaenotheca gracillima]
MNPESASNSQRTSPIPSHNGSTTGSVEAGTQLSKQNALAKKRKMTPAEREEKQKEKERKEQMKAEQKAQREAEKRLKDEEKKKKEEQRDEEKRKREEEREEKKRAKELENSKKELERKQKEEEKQRKEDEREKKEKSQMRLNSFFPKPTVLNSETISAISNVELLTNEDHRSSGAHASLPIARLEASPTRASASPQKASVTGFEQVFPPFFVQSHVTLAPSNRFYKKGTTFEPAREAIDLQFRLDRNSDSIENSHNDPIALRQLFPNKKRRLNTNFLFSTREIVDKIQESTCDSVDQTQHHLEEAEELLQALPIKHLRFAEDVRPPYRGTFARKVSESSKSSLGRAPFRRILPSIDYDYDSEAEWEEPDPEDGEDLGSEGEEEVGSEDEGDEMDDFLDDEDIGDGLMAPGAKRRAIVGDLAPVNSGLRWETADGKTSNITAGDAKTTDLNSYRMEIIHDAMKGPIDPFSDSYWSKPSHKADSRLTGATTGISTQVVHSGMNPPRVPLHATNRSNVAINNQLQLVDSGGKLVKPVRTPTMRPNTGKVLVEGNDLQEFKKAIEGSDLTKTGLIEVLKKQSVPPKPFAHYKK